MNTQHLLQKPKPLVIAHRGNQVKCPENTMSAFHEAVRDGADIIETDIRLTADGEFVCIHDETVDRTTNGNGRVEELTLSELQKLKANKGWRSFENERIPFLNELGSLFSPTTYLALELKSDRFLESKVCSRLVNKLSAMGILEFTFFLSFSESRLQCLKAVYSGAYLGWITLKSLLPLTRMHLIGPFWPLLYINPFFVRIAHMRGKWVCPLDPLPDTRLWYYRFLGCDAVLSDDPGKTIRKLKRAVS